MGAAALEGDQHQRHQHQPAVFIRNAQFTNGSLLLCRTVIDVEMEMRIMTNYSV